MLTTLALASTLAMGQVSVSVSLYASYDNLKLTSVSPGNSGGSFIAGLENGEVKVMDSAKKESIATVTAFESSVQAAAISPDGGTVVIGDDLGRIYLVKVRGGQKLITYPREKGHGRGIQSIAFSPGGTQFATIARDDTLRVWNKKGGDPVAIVNGDGANFYGLAYSPAGSIYVGTLSEGIRIYTAKGDLAATLTNPTGEGSNFFAMNKSARVGLSCSRSGRVYVWDLARRKYRGVLEGHQDYVKGASVSPNGKIGATSSSDGTVKVWDLTTLKCLGTYNDMASPCPLAFTPDGKYLAAANAGDSMQIFSVRPGQGR
ncbi:MAG: WD40 repeat domain-containing protein [Fimbriimonadaceae bacterium]|nr:WD40 repeat domain-containing protein [Fimbriimonadaceae bacterium]